ncbi:PGPGW domain-containing protein [Parvularcula dongshanensis]|uniref:Uncharacterized protein n=1 Tax=Parvularcula dongshanensis TaxID=1173995 RepID=A0A840I355_9PROT|nr:PGPGW domain-containing protein [Parvularcula dongshanensis]MBB4658765.1 hypothetical protein [Parvularcula dongshanensis]
MEAVSSGALILAHKFLGSTMLVCGAVFLPLPIPLGLPLIALGLAFLAPYFDPAQTVIRSLRRRAPGFDVVLIKHAHRCPRVIQTTIERTAPAF